MTGLQKMFLLLIGGYIVFKLVFALLFHVVLKRVGKKGTELRQRRLAIRQKKMMESANSDKE